MMTDSEPELDPYNVVEKVVQCEEESVVKWKSYSAKENTCKMKGLFSKR